MRDRAERERTGAMVRPDDQARVGRAAISMSRLSSLASTSALREAPQHSSPRSAPASLRRDPHDQRLGRQLGDHRLDGRGVAPVEPVGDPEQAAQPADDGLIVRRKGGEVGVLPPRAGAPVVAADQRHQPALAGRQAEALGVGDELEAVLVVLPIAHQLADVVQQSRRLEQQPLLGLAAELLAELVEELERQVAHLLHVPPVALAALGELAEEPERIGRADLLGPRHLEQQPLAQPERAHREDAGPEPVQQLRRDGEAGEDDVGALGVETGHLPALLRRPARQPVDELLDLRGRDAHARAPCRRRAGRGAPAPCGRGW